MPEDVARTTEDPLLSLSAIARHWEVAERTARKLLDSKVIPVQIDSAGRRVARLSDVTAYRPAKRQRAVAKADTVVATVAP